jgi:Uma2 family endonuclease
MATVIAAPMTLEEFARLPQDGARHEMNAGELLTLPPPKPLHALVALAVLEALQEHLKRHNSSRAVPEAGYLLSSDPLTIRQPDVSVISRERIRTANLNSYFEGAPELAVEIVSPSDSAEDLDIKTKQYLQNGAQQVWILYPKTQTVHVFSRGAATVILDQDQTLEGGDVLPGFAVPVASLFAI